MKRIPLVKFNQMIDRISSNGYNYPTMNAYLQDRYQYIVVGSERKCAGHLRSYTDVKKYGKSIGYDVSQFYTYKDYKQDLKDIFNYLGEYATEEGFYKAKREKYETEIEEWIGEGAYLDDLTTSQLRDILNYAWSQAKKDPEYYANFADNLKNELLEAKGYV